MQKKAKPKTHSLSILLVKEGKTTADEIVDATACDPPVDVPISGLGSCLLYVKRSHPQPPRWAALFKEFLDEKSLAVPRVSAVLLAKHVDRFFAITFGQGGRFLLRNDVHEERFGLLCALNAVDPSSFRCVDVQSLDAIQSHSRIQAGEATSPEQFGLDVEQDMLKAIVGTPKNPALGSRMTGSDSLSVSVRMTLGDLPFLLSEYKKQFDAELSAEDHQWVNNISPVKKPDLIQELEEELVSKLAAKDTAQIWLSIPEIINWASVAGFMYSRGRGEVHTDITLDGFMKTLAPKEEITLDLLRKRRVDCADADHQKVHNSWPVFRCLYAEIDKGKHKYILNDGKWFRVDQDFVERTNRDFANITYANFSLPIYVGGGEGAYNISVAAEAPDKYALLDQKTVQHGGGHGRVEVCDLLSAERHLIHVKLYGKSSVLSHLFSQGFVSGQLLQIDPGFRIKVREKLDTPFDALIDCARKPSEDGFAVVYAIISTAAGASLHLPFFSRVSLNNVAKVLRGFGYKVQLLKINVDDTFAKTSKLRPKMPRKKRAVIR